MDDRLNDGPTLKEFYEDRIVPMLLQRQSVVVIAPTRTVMTRLSEIADSHHADTNRQAPTLYRFDKEPSGIENQ